MTENEPIAAYEQVLDLFKKALRKNDLKFTAQREMILRCIYENIGHFTPEMLREQIIVRYGKQKIGIATIYRALSLMEDERIVSSISFGVNGKKYEFGMKGHHDHMICDQCGAIIEFVDNAIEKQQKTIAKKHNFSIRSHTLQIRGYCSICKKEILASRF